MDRPTGNNTPKDASSKESVHSLRRKHGLGLTAGIDKSQKHILIDNEYDPIQLYVKIRIHESEFRKDEHTREFEAEKNSREYVSKKLAFNKIGWDIPYEYRPFEAERVERLGAHWEQARNITADNWSILDANQQEEYKRLNTNIHEAYTKAKSIYYTKLDQDIYYTKLDRYRNEKICKDTIEELKLFNLEMAKKRNIPVMKDFTEMMKKASWILENFPKLQDRYNRCNTLANPDEYAIYAFEPKISEKRNLGSELDVEEYQVKCVRGTTEIQENIKNMEYNFKLANRGLTALIDLDVKSNFNPKIYEDYIEHVEDIFDVCRVIETELNKAPFA
jgi:hypothetical protein